MNKRLNRRPRGGVTVIPGMYAAVDDSRVRSYVSVNGAPAAQTFRQPAGRLYKTFGDEECLDRLRQPNCCSLVFFGSSRLESTIIVYSGVDALSRPTLECRVPAA